MIHSTTSILIYEHTPPLNSLTEECDLKQVAYCEVFFLRFDAFTITNTKIAITKATMPITPHLKGLFAQKIRNALEVTETFLIVVSKI